MGTAITARKHRRPAGGSSYPMMFLMTTGLFLCPPRKLVRLGLQGLTQEARLTSSWPCRTRFMRSVLSFPRTCAPWIAQTCTRNSRELFLASADPFLVVYPTWRIAGENCRIPRGRGNQTSQSTWDVFSGRTTTIATARTCRWTWTALMEDRLRNLVVERSLLSRISADFTTTTNDGLPEPNPVSGQGVMPRIRTAEQCRRS